MSIPVMAIEIAPDTTVVFNATLEGYQQFLHANMEQCKVIFENRQGVFAKLMALESKWMKVDPSFISTIMNNVESLSEEEKIGILNQTSVLHDEMEVFFQKCYKELSSQIAEESRQEPDPTGTSPTEPVSVTRIQDPNSFPRIAIDWNALASNRGVRWGVAGALIGGAFAWFLSSRPPRRIEDRK